MNSASEPFEPSDLSPEELRRRDRARLQQRARDAVAGRPAAAVRLRGGAFVNRQGGATARTRNRQRAQDPDPGGLQPGPERLAPTPLSTICFRYRHGAGRKTGDGTDLTPVRDDPHAAANEELMARVNRGGRIFVSHTRLRGRLALRLAIGNLRTTAADVQEAWQTLLDACPPGAR